MINKHASKFAEEGISKEVRAIGYARESRNKYCGNNKNKKIYNDKMAEQKREIKEYCKKHKIKLVNVICEIRTGTKNDLYTRPGLQIVRNYLHERKANTIITSDFDRLTRNIDFTEDLIKDILPYYGYISVSEHVDTTKYKNDKKIRRLAKFAAKESETIRKRCKRSIDERLRKNLYTGGRLKYGTKKMKNGKLYSDDKEQEIIDLMFQLRDDGLSYGKIAETLNIQGVRTHYGHIWNKGSLHKIMKRCEKDRSE